MLSQTIKDGLIEAVRAAARSEIMPRFRNLDAESIFSKSDADDLVTIADQRAEAAISEAARALMPEALIVGEEAVEDDPSLLTQMRTAGQTVIIDPIDGTSNFAAGLAVFGVILAVQMQGETVFGLLYDPIMDDWIEAEPGKGATFVNSAGRRQLTGSATKPIAQTTGHVPLFMFEQDARHRLASALPNFKRITSLRCSCHEYRQMALGQVDFTLNRNAKPWDHAAGALVLSECGGLVETTDGAAYDATHPVAPLWAFGFQDKEAQDKIKAALLG